MKRALAVVGLLWSGCANVHVNRATLIASTAALACDWGQTRHASADGWARFSEHNPVLGGRPSTNAIDLYFASALAINAALWMAMPTRYRAIIPVAVTGLQASTITGNAVQGAGVCGLGGSTPSIESTARSY